MENRNNVDKDIAHRLSKLSGTRTGAVSLGLDTLDGINKWYADERAKLLEGKEKSLIKTNVDDSQSTNTPVVENKERQAIKPVVENKEKQAIKTNQPTAPNTNTASIAHTTKASGSKETDKGNKSNIKTNVRAEVQSNDTLAQNINSTDSKSTQSVLEGNSYIIQTAKENKAYKSNIQTNVNVRSNNNGENQNHSKIQTNVNNKKTNAVAIADNSETVINTSESKGKDKKSSFLVRRGVFTKNQSKPSKAITVGLKSVKNINRGFNKVYRIGKRVQEVSSGESNIQTNLKSVSNATKKVVTKPVGMTAKPIRRKVKQKVQNGLIKLVRLAFKALKAVGKLLIKVLGAALSSLPVVAILFVVIIVVVSSFSIFGGGMSDDKITELKQYMQETQQEYDDITVPFYEDGNIVENGIEGKGYINWKAALSVLQGLGHPDAQVAYDDADKYILIQWEAQGLLETVEDVEYKEKVKEVKKGKDGKEDKIIEKEVTKTKKVITIPGLNDYINWCNAHWDVQIVQFLHLKGIKSNATSLSDEQIEIINSLYNSEYFSELLGDDFLHSVTGNVISGGGNGILRYPTSSRSISAGFPNYSDGSYHGAIDFPIAEGSDVCAAEDGTVLVAGWYNESNKSDGYGIYVVISHIIDGKTIITLYGHNSSVLVKAGDVVKRGQVIAKSGNTGNSTGPHCHFEVQLDHIWGTRVNPLDYLGDGD